MKNDDDVKRIVDETIKKFGKIDVLASDLSKYQNIHN